MTPFGIVFLTLMFGIITPSPTDGKINLTFRQMMKMEKCSTFEKGPGVTESPEEKKQIEVFCHFMDCLDKLRHGENEECDEGKANADLDALSKKYNKLVQNVPFDAWEGHAKLQCKIGHVCGTERKVCSCFPKGSCDGVPKPMPGDCKKEFAAYRELAPASPGVRVSISGWSFTVMVATACTISGRHLFSA